MEKENKLFAAKEIRKLHQDLNDMYGRISGMGAVYDSMIDRAEKLEHQAL